MKPICRFAAPFAATLLLGTSSAFAQPNTPAAPMNGAIITKTAPALAPLDDANWRAIRVQYARPSLLAYQLDPEHNSLPAFFNIPGFLADRFREGDAKLKRVPKGPFEGVRLVGADEQNLLFVAGKSEQQIAQIQEMVTLLDHPTRRVQIEAQFVELPVAEMKQFGIDFSAMKAEADIKSESIRGAFQVGFVRDNFRERLDELVKAGQAKTLSIEPLIIGNNTSQAVSLLSGPIDNTGANQYKSPSAPKAGSDTIVTLTPTINGDDTITVLMNIETLPNDAAQRGLQTVANVRDGDTIALGGLSSSAFPYKVPLIGDIPLISELGQPRTAEDERMFLVFVTARIARDGQGEENAE